MGGGNKQKPEPWQINKNENQTNKQLRTIVTKIQKKTDPSGVRVGLFKWTLFANLVRLFLFTLDFTASKRQHNNNNITCHPNWKICI